MDIITGVEPSTLLVAITIGTILIGGILYLTLTSSKTGPAAIKADEFQAFQLSKKDYISHDTLRVTFDLQTPETLLGLPVGSHITLRFVDGDGKSIQRSYTPVTGNETLGKVTFVIKVYKAGIHPKFPDGGKMSQHLDSLNVGDTIDMKGPKGHLTYLGRGKFTVKHLKTISNRRAKHFGMIAGGTGITPMLQLINAILRDEKDQTKMSLIFANQTEDDILLRETLENIAKKYPERFSLHYTLDRPPASGWNYSTGFIDEKMLRDHMPAPSKDGTSQILMCGPPPMIKFACIPNLEKIGFKETEWFKY